MSCHRDPFTHVQGHSMSNTTSGLPSVMEGGIQILALPTRDLSCIMRTQVVLARSPDGSTEKLHLWNAPESDADPHNHPWEWCESRVLYGSITEELFEVVDGNLVSLGERTHVAGDTYRFERKHYHRTVSVEPGTVTHFVTGPHVTDANGWGWHNGTDHVEPEKDGAYFAALKAANPTFAGGSQWPALVAAVAPSLFVDRFLAGEWLDYAVDIELALEVVALHRKARKAGSHLAAPLSLVIGSLDADSMNTALPEVGR